MNSYMFINMYVMINCYIRVYDIVFVNLSFFVYYGIGFYGDMIVNDYVFFNNDIVIKWYIIIKVSGRCY